MISFVEPRAVEVEGGRIVRSVRSSRASLRLDGRALELPDDARILPGFVDAHCHLIGPGQMGERVWLGGRRSAADCLDAVSSFADAHPDLDWVLGFGWNDEEWEEPEEFSREILDRILPDRPLVLYRIDTHGVWCNTRALEQGGIRALASEENREVIPLRSDGEPSGLLLEGGVKWLEAGMPAPGEEDFIRWYRTGIDYVLRFGITEVHDMNVQPEWLPALVKLAESGELPIRVRLFLDGTKDGWKEFDRPGMIAPNLYVDGVKFFADGALGSRGALLLEPYADEPSTRGVGTITADELDELARGPLDRGLAIATHAIGDAANRIVLDGYRPLRSAYPHAILRIEHAQIVHPEDIPRFSELRVLPSVQPIHCTSDIRMAERRLGPDRTSIAYSWRSLIETGLPLLAGSDFPIESGDPWKGIESFVERRGPDRRAWHPEERIDPHRAIAAYTAWPHLGLPDRARRGRLQRGFDGDVVVWEGGRALYVIRGGEIVRRDQGS